MAELVILGEVMRLKNWPGRFAELVESARARPFEWGSHDCCLWGADSVLALTGNDLAAQWRGTYSDALSAARLLKQLGGLEALAATAGPEMPPSFAAQGDVGLVEANAEDGSLSIAVCAGHSWLVVGESGLLSFPTAVRAWRVA